MVQHSATTNLIFIFFWLCTLYIVQDQAKGNSIKVLKPNIDFEALMELGRYDSFHVHLLQYLQDEECDKLDQILREVGQLLRKPIGLEQEDTIWWR